MKVLTGFFASCPSCVGEAAGSMRPSFDDCMADARPLAFGLWSSRDKQILASLSSQYSTLWRDRTETEASTVNAHAQEQTIPRLLHFIWLGPKPLPDNFDSIQQSWVKHNPQWQLRLWRDAAVTALQLENAAAFAAAR